jgi:DNA-directed RNA polymerase specialized sigma24 family protein
MAHFDDFFKANYRRMVGYCTAQGHREADVEEEVADVIYKHFDEYRAQVEGPQPETTMRRWMNRRVLLNLGSRYKRHENAKTDQLDDIHEQVSFDDPAVVVDLMQRLPPVPAILIDYEPYGIRESDGTQRRKPGGPKGANTSADKTRFCRERKKFLTTLGA